MNTPQCDVPGPGSTSAGGGRLLSVGGESYVGDMSMMMGAAKSPTGNVGVGIPIVFNASGNRHVPDDGTRGTATAASADRGMMMIDDRNEDWAPVKRNVGKIGRMQDSDDDEDTLSDGDDQIDQNELFQRAADQAFNTLVDVSAKAEATFYPMAPSQLQQQRLAAAADQDKQIRDMSLRMQRDLQARSQRSAVRAEYAIVALHENLKLLDRLCEYDPTAAIRIEPTRAALEKAQRITRKEATNMMLVDEVYAQSEQLSDHAQALFLQLTELLQRHQAIESGEKLMRVLKSLSSLYAVAGQLGPIEKQRREIRARVQQQVQELVERAMAEMDDAQPRAKDDVRNLILNDRLMRPATTYADADIHIQTQLHSIMQVEVRDAMAATRLSTLLNELEIMVTREQKRLDVDLKTQAMLPTSYKNAIVKFAQIDDADLRACIAWTPQFDLSAEEFRCAPVTKPGSWAPSRTPLAPLSTPGRAPSSTSNAAISATLSRLSQGGGPSMENEAPNVAIGSAFKVMTPSAEGKRQSQVVHAAPQHFMQMTDMEGAMQSPILQIPVSPLGVVSVAAMAAAASSSALTATQAPRPQPSAFEHVRCATSTDQVVRYICRCRFDNGEVFEWYYMFYQTKNQKELEFPYSETQQLSVVLPDHLFVVDSICECMSTIHDTVVSLKSKKKSFFRALTNLGYAHKMQAKRMKKFQKQAWCATVQGTMEWIKRVRSFSTNTLQIDDIELERLISFIENRIMPILEVWDQNVAGRL